MKLTWKESEVIMMIRDNGQGFQLDVTNGSHFGLTMMNERVEAVAGKLSIESSLDEGTIVLAQWQPPR